MIVTSSTADQRHHLV